MNIFTRFYNQLVHPAASRNRTAELESANRCHSNLLNALDTASMAIVISDNQGQVSYSNRRMLEMVQHTENKILLEALHPEDKKQYLDFRDHLVASDIENTIEVRLLGKDSDTRWLRINARPFSSDEQEKSKFRSYLETIEEITNQKNDAEIIRLSEDRYRIILDSITDDYWESDLHGQFVSWNRAFEKNMNLRPEQIRSLRRQDYIVDSEMAEAESVYRQVLKTGEPAMLLTRLYRFNSDLTIAGIRSIQNSVHLKKDADASPIGFFGFSRDITKQKETERALRESEDKFKVMSDQSLLGISIMQDDKSLYRNDAMTRIFGYSHEEMNALFDAKFLYQKVIHPDYRDFTAEQNWKKQHGITAGLVHNYQYRIFTKQGDTKWVDQYSKTVTYGGKPANLITMIDITDQKRAEEELLDSKHRMSAHIQQTPMGIIEFDNRFIVTSWNPAAEEIFGFSSEEAIGRNTFDFLVPEYDREKVEKVHALTDPRSNKHINDNLTKDGRIITVQWFNTPIRDQKGNLVGMAAACQNITEQLKTQKLLVQSEKMMSIGGLAAGMAHEINNPLGAILQLTQNLERRLDPAFKKNVEIAEKHQIDLNRLRGYLEERGIIDFLDAIMQSGKRAAKIITDMLHFSRKSNTEKVPTDLNELLERSLELAEQDYDLKKRYDFRHIEIRKEFDTSLPPVDCSETEIEQVFLNLLKNCTQAFRSEEVDSDPLITLRTARDNEMVRVEIEDNGPGMEESVRSRIFEPFYTTKPVGEGTGLGLSVSYMIITGHHQGTMTVESRPGYGTKFIIHLPLVAAPEL